MSKQKKNLLELYLTEVFKNFISLKDNDVKKSQEVFKSVFDQVRESMGKQCNYFSKYSSQVMYGGSVYDGIKVAKLDEFDMDIVIRLPISYDDGENGIIIENEQPGFVKLKITKAFDNLLKQGEWENCHKVTHTWRDNESYLRQDKFRNWIQSVVQKSMNDFNGKITVNGVVYSIQYTQSGPAYTLKIASLPDDEPFKLDVDLVPVIRFTHPRWPKDYRDPKTTTAKDWLVVPKPNKAIKDAQLQNRCWRLSFQDFEKEMMKGCQNLKTTIRLVKKVRDVLKLKKIVTHYIRTIFLWKISNTCKGYWETKLSVLFKAMIQELYDAINDKNIPCYWHKKHNLLANLPESLCFKYAVKLEKLLQDMVTENANGVLEALLTNTELAQFKDLDVYKKYSTIHKPTTSGINVQNVSSQRNELVLNLFDKMEVLSGNVDKLINSLDKLNVGGSSKRCSSAVPSAEQTLDLKQVPVQLAEGTNNSEDSDYDYDYNCKRRKLANGNIVKIKKQI